MKYSLSTLAVAVLLGGCAGNSPEPVSTSAATGADAGKIVKTKTAEEISEKDRILCSREVTTGSHRKSRKCRTIAQRDAEREDAQRVLRSIQQGGTKPAN